MQICPGEPRDNVWPQYLLMISRLRSGSGCSDKNFLINNTETAANTSHHVSPSPALSGPRALLGPGWPLPFQPLPSFLSLHGFYGWLVTIIMMIILCFMLRLCIRWPVWQVREIFSGPQQVPGDIWTPGPAGGNPFIGGPAGHPSHHAGQTRSSPLSLSLSLSR